MLTQSRIVRLGKHWTERITKKKIFKLLRPILKDPNIADKLKNPNDRKEIEELEYKHFFED